MYICSIYSMYINMYSMYICVYMYTHVYTLTYTHTQGQIANFKYIFAILASSCS